MAETKQLKSIKFPGLEDTYTIPQKLSDLEQDIDTSTLKAGDGVDSMIPATTQGATGTGDEKDPTPVASGRSAIALGRYTRAPGSESVALNYQNKANAKNSFAANANNEVNGTHGAAFGYSNFIKEGTEAAFVTGIKNIASATGQSVHGLYSKEDSDAMLIIGDGTGESESERSNAFKVYGKKSPAGRSFTLGNTTVTESALDLMVFDAKNPLFQRHSMGGTDPHMILQLDNDNTGASYTVVMGRGNTVTGYDSAAFGIGNTVEGTSSFTANANNTIYGKHATAFGYKNTIKENTEGAFVTGIGNIASTSCQSVHGLFAEEDAEASFIIGAGSNESNRKNVFAVYSKNNSSHGNAIVIGDAVITDSLFNAMKNQFQYPYLSGSSSGSVIQQGNTGGSQSISLGWGNAVTGQYSVALGANNAVGENYSFAACSNNVITNKHCAAFGNRNEVSGVAAFALGGNNNKATGANSVVAGHMNIASGAQQFVTGVYNAEDADAAFIIGNGTSDDNRSNAFVVKKDGTVKINDVVMPTIYSGTEEPDNFEGKDGDIYIMYEE